MADYGSFSYNHGQCCCAGSRIFVHANIYDEFLQRFTEHTQSLKVGDPFSPETFQRPQINQQQYDVSARARPHNRSSEVPCSPSAS